MPKYGADISITFEADGPNTAYEKLKAALENLEGFKYEIEEGPDEIEPEEEDDEE